MCKYQYMTYVVAKNMKTCLINLNKIRVKKGVFLNAWKYKWRSMTSDLKFSS